MTNILYKLTEQCHHYQVRQKVSPLKNSANFSRTTERHDITFHSLVTHSIIRKCAKVSLHYLHNWQNYAAFSHGNLAVETLSKIVSTIQDSANAVRANTFLSRYKYLECLPSPFTYCYQTICKTRDGFINWTCGKVSHIFSSVIFNPETALGRVPYILLNLPLCLPTVSCTLQWTLGAEINKQL